MGASGSEGSAGRRVVPVLGSVAGLLLAAAVIGWALLGPAEAPAEVDLAAHGFAVSEDRGDPPPLAAIDDPLVVLERLQGWQRDISGRLGLPVPVADGSWSAPVTDAVPGSDAGFGTAVLGAVRWDGEGDDDAAYTACRFARAVPFDDLTAAGERRGDEVRADLTDLVATCDGDDAWLVAPLVEIRVPELSLADRLRGRTARGSRLPAGVVVADPDGRVEVTDGAPVRGLRVYPGEVARESLAEAVPDNPALDGGTWIRPLHPMTALVAGELRWVTPVSPPGEPEVTVGYASVPADEIEVGRVSPVAVRWLTEPQPGHAEVLAAVEALLVDLGEDAADRGEIWISLPDDGGRRSGHVAQPLEADDVPELLYRIAWDGRRACLTTPAGEEVGCNPEA